jgi:uncharacterized protein (TIGR04255 family)
MTTFAPRPRPAELPDFADPPVDEVVIGLMFMPVGGFSTNHVAKYREAVKHDFPGLQYQPRLMVQLENLAAEPFGAQLPIGLLTPQAFQPAQRTWLVAGDDQRLLQLQEDAFLSNWRRRNDPYPRFELLLQDFWSRFALFRSQLSSDSVIPLQIQQLEVSYINWVPFETSSLDDWFQPAKSSYVPTGADTLRAEHLAWNASYVIRDEGVSVARMHARQMEALRTGPGVPHLGAQLELTYRAPLAPGASDDEIIDRAFQARDKIVWAFTGLTTDEAHTRWGRRK